MNIKSFISTNEIRTQFTQAMSKMYQLEVPQYKKLLSLTKKVNQDTIKDSSSLTDEEIRLLSLEHHGAIRVGSREELSTMRRLFAVMGMYPVDYYDLSVAAIPVHSTAFRALDISDLQESPFRVFCSLLRLDLIDDEKLRLQAENLLNKRQIFPEQLLSILEISEKQGYLTFKQSENFIEQALDVFRWYENASVEKHVYDELKKTHGLVADVVSFNGPHINHLTPKVLDIDGCQNSFKLSGIRAKENIEGPPRRSCPILLRQTSFLAIEENIVFSDGESGLHTARFGEVEQRGIALTPKGRNLYDRLLIQAKNNDQDLDYDVRLKKAFLDFPDDYDEIRQQKLAYFYYSVNDLNKRSSLICEDIETLISLKLVKATPIIYQDFLPVSAAGIFTSNLSEQSFLDNKIEHADQINENLSIFENALGSKVNISFELYEKLQNDSLKKTLATFR